VPPHPYRLPDACGGTGRAQTIYLAGRTSLQITAKQGKLGHLAAMKDKAIKYTIPIIAPLLLLLCWQCLAPYIDNEIILPSPDSVFAILVHPDRDLISMGSLLGNIIVSLARVASGYFTAVLVAVPLGILMGYYGTVNRFFSNFLGIFRPIPPLAWVPLVLAWFGVASLATLLEVEPGQYYLYLNNLKFSMIFIIFIGGFYPVLTSTITGVRSVRKTLIDSARVLGARKRDIFLKVLLPGAAPGIVIGMRIGLGVSWMCLVSAEMLPGSMSGVGYLITHAFTIARTDVVIAGMISIGTVGALLDLGFRWFEDKKFTWQALGR
jgi:NitT/TauT family transport system permease protein